MPSQPPIPPLLSPILSSNSLNGSLTLLTSVLAAPTNWLVLRFLYAVLKNRGCEGGEGGETNIVLASWLRNWHWWKEGGKKLGIDFSKGTRIRFLDGLGADLQRGIRELEEEILGLVRDQMERGRKVLIILDGMDFLTAGMGAEVEEVMAMVAEIREHAHSMIIVASADAPLIHTRTTPLETNHAAFVMGVAHQAKAVLGIRELDTGAARDVSGVLRIARGAGEGGDEVEEREVLFFVGGDGGVKVFERGA